jgi:hypothetical protein
MEQKTTQLGAIRPWLLITFGVVVLIALGYIGWMYWINKNTLTPTPTTNTTSTADWKTYTNNFGYSIKYPIDWTVDSKDPKAVTLNSAESISNNSKCNGEGPNCENDVTIFYFNQLTDLTQGSNATNLEDYINNSTVLNESKKITFAGEPAVEGTEGGISAWYNIYVEKSGHIYEIHFGKAATKDEINPIEQQILSTFQFTDSPAVSTAGWKTYTNAIYNFSIKYPSDLTKSEDRGLISSAPNQLSWVGFTNTAKYGSAIIAVEVSKNTYSDISDWATKTNSDGIAAGAYTIKNTTIDGIAGKELSTSIEGGAVRTGFIKGNNLYIIHRIGTDAAWEDFNNPALLADVYNQILSTFQFSK